MRARKLLGMAVVLVALAVTINALAYTSATVNNTFSLSIVSSGAALDIQPVVSPDAGLGTLNPNGYLNINMLDKIQPNASYSWGPVFTVSNNAQQPVQVWMEWGTPPPSGVTVSLMDGATAMPFTEAGAITVTTTTPRTFSLSISTGSTVTPMGAWSPTLTLRGKK